MSQNSQGSFSLALTLAIGIFLVAFACLWTLGDFRFFPAAFLAAVIAAIVWLVLYLGFSRSNHSDDAMASGSSSSPATTSSASTSTATTAAAAAPAAAAAASTAREPSAEAAEAKRLADEQAAERAAADEVRRKAEAAEALEAKRKADEAAAADAKRRADEAAAAEAKRKADEASAAEARRAEEAAAARREAEAAASKPAMTDNAAAATTPDYDGDGVREGTNEGTRPAGLDAPRNGKADDLKQIKGIGAKMEALCNRLGFWHFDQIANWTADEVAWVDANLEGFKGRVTRDTWVEQAGILARGGETEFSKRVEDGDVY